LSGLDTDLILCYIIDTKRGKRQTGGYFFLLKEKIVNIITVKAVRNIPICVKSLSVMYTASPPFKVLSHFGR